MTDTEHAHIHVHCDTCTGEHELEFPISPEYTIQEAANLFLVAQGWETFQDRVNDVQRHRCVACVTLRDRLTEAQRKQEQLARLLDGHS